MSDKSPFDLSLLLCSEPFQRLLTIERVVSPFEVFGIESNELVHSRILGQLLAFEGPLAYGATLVPRLAAALRYADSRAPLDASWLVKLSAARFRVRLEHPCWLSDKQGEDLGRLDLLLEDEVQKIALVVENKIWAGEQDRQIERYQTWLSSARTGWRSLVIYLTPSGRPPSPGKLTPRDLRSCVCLSWANVHKALEGIDERDSSGVVKAFRQNIQRHIMRESEEKRLVREIMSNPDLAAVVHKIVENLPKFSDLQEDIERGVSEITRMEIKSEIYPEKRGDARHFKIYLKPWKEAGIPICFHFYNGELPALRTMVHVNDWPKFEPTAKLLAAQEGSAIHTDCPIREEWREWRLVMADDSDTKEAWKKTTISDLSFSESSAKALLDLFRERFFKLKPTIDAFLDRNQALG